jgi:hypothetical protein
MWHFDMFVTLKVFKLIGPSNDSRRQGRGTYLLLITYVKFRKFSVTRGNSGDSEAAVAWSIAFYTKKDRVWKREWKCKWSRHLEEYSRDEERRKQLKCDQPSLRWSWWWHRCPMPVEQTELVRLWVLRTYDLELSEIYDGRHILIHFAHFLLQSRTPLLIFLCAVDTWKIDIRF